MLEIVLVAAGLAAAMILAAEFGYRAYALRRPAKAVGDADGLNIIMSSTMTLAGLLAAEPVPQSPPRLA
jgi:hypothetical protein